jgi:hypothetical protein
LAAGFVGVIVVGVIVKGGAYTICRCGHGVIVELRWVCGAFESNDELEVEGYSLFDSFIFEVVDFVFETVSADSETDNDGGIFWNLRV